MKILLATDGTDRSDAAVDALRSFNLRSGDEIEIVSVIEVLYPAAIDIYGGYLPDTDELLEKERDAASVFLQEASAKASAFFRGEEIRINTGILSGSPDSAIVGRAEEMGADVIVVGSHGYRAWERLLIGSVS